MLGDSYRFFAWSRFRVLVPLRSVSGVAGTRYVIRVEQAGFYVGLRECQLDLYFIDEGYCLWERDEAYLQGLAVGETFAGVVMIADGRVALVEVSPLKVFFSKERFADREYRKFVDRYGRLIGIGV